MDERELQKAIDRAVQAGMAQADFLVEEYMDERGCHAETLIGASGALIGAAIQSSAYARAMGGDGHVMEFEKDTNPPFRKFVNCLHRLRQFAEKDYVLFLKIASQGGAFPAEAAPDIAPIVGFIVDQLDGDWFPRLSAPLEHWPHEWSPNAAAKYKGTMRLICARHEVDEDLEVLAACMALARCVAQVREVLPPDFALRLGFEMAVATANIGNLNSVIDTPPIPGAPLPSQTPPAPTEATKPDQRQARSPERPAKPQSPPPAAERRASAPPARPAPQRPSRRPPTPGGARTTFGRRAARPS